MTSGIVLGTTKGQRHPSARQRLLDIWRVNDLPALDMYYDVSAHPLFRSRFVDAGRELAENMGAAVSYLSVGSTTPSVDVIVCVVDVAPGHFGGREVERWDDWTEWAWERVRHGTAMGTVVGQGGWIAVKEDVT